MQTDLPFFEDTDEALRASIQALGGAKKVGGAIWPDKSVEDARNLLLNCTNPARPEKLDYTQIIFVFREAKRAGYSAGFQWFASQCEFDAHAVTLAEEADRLATVIAQSTKTLAAALAMAKNLQRAA